MPEFQTIKSGSIYEETERRSKFISYSFSVASELEIHRCLNEIKLMHPNAKHYVYAYILKENNAEKYSDDGEPSGTAGIPILNAIRSAELKNVLVIVVRYFGGILLGAPGLRKMYGSGAVGVLSRCEKVNMLLSECFILSIDYKAYGKIVSILSQYNAKIDKVEYSDKINIHFDIKQGDIYKVLDKISDILKGDEKLESLGKKYCIF